MNKQHKELKTLTEIEIAQAMDAGLNVLVQGRDYRWYKPRDIIRANKYRIEVKQPETGDEILVWDINETYAEDATFLCMWKDKIVAENKSGYLQRFSEWKWPEEKKPAPREGWVFPHNIWPCEVETGMINIKEVL